MIVSGMVNPGAIFRQCSTGRHLIVCSMNAELVRSASRAENRPYGDSTRREVLHAVNFERARYWCWHLRSYRARRTVASQRDEPSHTHHRSHAVHVRIADLSSLAPIR